MKIEFNNWKTSESMSEIYVPRYRGKGLGRGGRAFMYYARRTKGPIRFRRGIKRPRRQFVARTMGPFATSESKYFDSETSGFAVAEETQNWAAANDVVKGVMCIPTEGTDIDNRIGRKIAIYKLAIKGVINPAILQDQADVLSAPCYRIIFWQDTQCNGTVTTSASLMQGGTAATAAVTFTAFQNPENFGRFRVLKDVVLRAGVPIASTDGANTTTITIPNIPFKLTHRWRIPLTIKFNAADNGNIGDIVDHAFYLSIQKSTVNYTETVTVRTRAYYKDA